MLRILISTSLWTTATDSFKKTKVYSPWRMNFSSNRIIQAHKFFILGEGRFLLNFFIIIIIIVSELPSLPVCFLTPFSLEKMVFF